jgi:hypothetical protein
MTMAYRKRHNGTTTQRGYGRRHQLERARWKPHVETGTIQCQAVICLMPYGRRIGRLIPPGAPWHLGHTPDRSGWTGPEHMQCNEADGARRGNRMRARIGTAAPRWPSARRW